VLGGPEIAQARDFLIARLEQGGFSSPRLAVVLGSGLGDAAPDLADSLEIPCNEVPGWPEHGVPGHAGILRCGLYGGKEALIQLGRLHYYEGLDMDAVAFPVSLLGELGIERVLMCNAAGALNPLFERGQMMLVRDHINLMGINPLRGVRDANGDPAFLDLSGLYDESAGDALMERARVAGWPLAEGVLVAVSGPTYETGAELRFMRVVGGDAVSMSLVPEALAARFLGISVTALSVITNVWDLRRPHAISHDEVLRTAGDAAPVLKRVIAAWMDPSGANM
jgi:purine-nucleoside phosphorylase